MKKLLLCICLCFSLIIEVEIHFYKKTDKQKVAEKIEFQPHNIKKEDLDKMIGAYDYFNGVEGETI